MKFITFLNSGCVDICVNMLTSATKVGLDIDDFIIACLDNQSYEKMKKYSGTFLYKNQEVTEYQNWSFDETSEFRKIVKSKWNVIKKIYEQHKELCWVDTDIVFVQNPLKFIQNNDKILFQCDRPGSLICSGFMVFNNTDACNSMINECGENETEDDQILINQIVLSKYPNDAALLDIELFPNGHLYYSQGMKSKAVIVHNNHMVGMETKINKFREEGLWYL